MKLSTKGDDIIVKLTSSFASIGIVRIDHVSNEITHDEDEKCCLSSSKVEINRSSVRAQWTYNSAAST